MFRTTPRQTGSRDKRLCPGDNIFGDLDRLVVVCFRRWGSQAGISCESRVDGQLMGLMDLGWDRQTLLLQTVEQLGQVMDEGEEPAVLDVDSLDGELRGLLCHVAQVFPHSSGRERLLCQDQLGL